MKKRVRRLNLNRETLRVLGARQSPADGAGAKSMDPSCLVFLYEATGCACCTNNPDCSLVSCSC